MNPVTDRRVIQLVLWIAGEIGTVALVGAIALLFFNRAVPDILWTIPSMALTGVLALLASTRSNPDPVPQPVPAPLATPIPAVGGAANPTVPHYATWVIAPDVPAAFTPTVTAYGDIDDGEEHPQGWSDPVTVPVPEPVV